MNNRRFLFALALVMFSATGVQAQFLPDFLFRAELGLATNYSLPGTNLLGASFGVGLGLGIGPVLVTASAGFDQFQADRKVLAEEHAEIWEGDATDVYSIANYPLSFITISGDVRYRFGDGDAGSSFYVVGGPAFFRMAQDDLAITSSKGKHIAPGNSWNSYGFIAGGGFDLAVFEQMIWLYAETKTGVGVAGGIDGFEVHYTNLRLGAELRL